MIVKIDKKEVTVLASAQEEVSWFADKYLESESVYIGEYDYLSKGGNKIGAKIFIVNDAELHLFDAFSEVVTIDGNYVYVVLDSTKDYKIESYPSLPVELLEKHEDYIIIFIGFY